MDLAAGPGPGALSTFKNSEPQTREERYALRDKDALEKKRLAERQVRMHSLVWHLNHYHRV